MSAWMEPPRHQGAQLYGRPAKSCHLMADSTEELLQLAQALGLKASWIQHCGTPKEHFDLISSTKIAQAQRLGVQVVSRRELVQRLRWRRKHQYTGTVIPPYQSKEAS
ncbi:MAG: DUF4031 domain-containing protein [Myxococcota bacterium]